MTADRLPLQLGVWLISHLLVHFSQSADYFVVSTDKMKSRILTSLSRLSSMPMFVKYNQVLEKRPMLTKCVTSGAIGIVSDVIAQTCFTDSFDIKRLINLCVNYIHKSFLLTFQRLTPSRLRGACAPFLVRISISFYSWHQCSSIDQTRVSGPGLI